MEKVAIVGASPKPERYSHKCMISLEEHNHKTFLVAPGKSEIEGRKVYPTLLDIDEKMDTVTIYIGPKRQNDTIEAILKIKPKRVIFNPGTENSEAYETLKSNGIKVIEACSLVMLSTGQY